jgi:hypothetical protein
MAKADSSAALRNDKQKNKQKQEQMHVVAGEQLR